MEETPLTGNEPNEIPAEQEPKTEQPPVIQPETLSEPPPRIQPPIQVEQPVTPVTPAVSSAQAMWARPRLELQKIHDAVGKVRHEMQKVIVGQDDMIELLLAGLFAGGHILLEGVPGIAKTLSAKMLSKTLSVDFSRIQFTPDLMPTDVVGTNIFNLKESEFKFRQGPIFSNIVLIDEINRAPAKTQAALFEVMEEKQITIDGVRMPLTFPFMVIATQNPIEQEGTYKLPEAQLDRFLFRIVLKYPSLAEEKQILFRYKQDFSMRTVEEVKAVFNAEQIKSCQEIVEKVHIKDELVNYIAEIVHDTRNNGDLFLGASPRASLAILKTAKAIAAMAGREFVTPDDIQYVAYPVLNHRIILSPEREMEGIDTEDVIKAIIQKIEVPR